MTSKFSTEEIYQGLKDKNISVLARAITLIESKLKSDQEKAHLLLKKISGENLIESPAVTIGISGPPGVGKSTFLESFGIQLLKKNPQLKIAVLTIDPSSNKVGGSILGDKTRMDKLSKHERAFIRPSPSSPFTGGLHKNTFDTIQLCRFFGFDYIFLESVGVGQVEVEIEHFVDYVWLLLQPGSGDELQSIKKGILEISQLYIINKFDHQLEGKAIELEKDMTLSFGKSKKIFKYSAYKKDLGLPLIDHLISLKNDESNSRIEPRKRQLKCIFDSYLSYVILNELNSQPKWLDQKEQKFSEILQGPNCFWEQVVKFKNSFIQK